MEGQQFVTPEAIYAQQVAQASGGAMPATGMAPYPLYGIGQTTPAAEPEVPFYRRNWFWALVGAGTVGAAWAYFGWVRPRSGRVSRNASWSKLDNGIWEKRPSSAGLARIFGSGDSWDWIADYQLEGGRYQSKTGSAGTLDEAQRAAERWLRRAETGAA